MRKVYEDQDMTMVGYYQTLLEEAGMETAIKNEFAQLAVGEIPFTQVYPELWVVEVSDYDAAVQLIRSVRDSQVDHAQRGRPLGYKNSNMMRSAVRAGGVCVVLLALIVLYSFLAA